MKNRIAAILLVMVFVLALGVSAMADDTTGKEFNVTFTASKTMEKDYTQDELSQAISNMQPGDSVTISFKLQNQSGSNTTWYISNEVADSLERSTSVTGGAYTYILSYTDPSGNMTELFNSDSVNSEQTDDDGLDAATESLDQWNALGELTAGQNASVQLTVALDGETQANNYQNSDAEITIQFAAEVEATTTQTNTQTTTNVVKTGDEFNMPVMVVVAGVSGLLVLALAIWGVVARKKEKEGAAK